MRFKNHEAVSQFSEVQMDAMAFKNSLVFPRQIECQLDPRHIAAEACKNKAPAMAFFLPHLHPCKGENEGQEGSKGKQGKRHMLIKEVAQCRLSLINVSCLFLVKAP